MRLLLLILILQSVLLSKENKTWQPYFTSPKRIGVSVAYDMGGLFFNATNENSISLGGLFGISSDLRINLFKAHKILGFIGGEVTYNYWSYNTKTGNYETDNDGLGGATQLLDLAYHYGIMIYDCEVFIGYRRYNGKEETSYDWWSDYTTSMAWDPKYAGYYWYEKNTVKLRGDEYGFNYHYFSTSMNRLTDFIFQFKIMRLDLIVEKINFWFISVIARPFWGEKGISGYIEYGNNSKLRVMRLRMGLGYSF